MPQTIVGYTENGDPIYGVPGQSYDVHGSPVGSGVPWYWGLGGGTDPNAGGGPGGGPTKSGGGLPWWQKLLGLIGSGSNSSGSGGGGFDWGKLAKAALPGILALFGSKKGGAQTPTDKMIQQFLQQQMGISQGLVSSGMGAIQPAISRFKSTIANPMSAIAPDINARATADRAAIGSAAELAPRGGASSDFLSRLPFTRIGENTNMAIGARSDAANKLGGIGANLINAGVSGGRGPATDLASLQNNQFSRGQQTGAGYYQILREIIDAYNGKKTGGDPSSPYYGLTG